MSTIGVFTIKHRWQSAHQNKKPLDRQGGKFTCKWLGPYTKANITKTGHCPLAKEKGETLLEKYNVSLLKRYFQAKPQLIP